VLFSRSTDMSSFIQASLVVGQDPILTAQVRSGILTYDRGTEGKAGWAHCTR